MPEIIAIDSNYRSTALSVLLNNEQVRSEAWPASSVDCKKPTMIEMIDYLFCKAQSTERKKRAGLLQDKIYSKQNLHIQEEQCCREQSLDGNKLRDNSQRLFYEEFSHAQ